MSTAAHRQAAAIVLVRGKGAAREVYLVERAPELRFFGGYWAFPGGVLADVDRDAEPERALRRCAVRELFEETGVLPAPLPTALEPAARDALRRELLAGADAPAWSALAPLVEQSLASVVRIMRITTPPFAPVRYETLFVLVELPPGEEPSIVKGELVAGRFVRPADAVHAWQRGELLIVPPVIFLLEMLAEGEGEERFLARAAEAESDLARGALHSVRFTPGIFVAPLRTPTLPPATTTNTLLVGTDAIFIVDPATPEPEEQQRLCDKLDALLAEGKRLEGILLTHHHPDHVGAVVPIRRRYRLPVMAHRLTFDRLDLDLDDPAERRELDEGDLLDLGTAPDGSPGWHLRVLFTPGHARGHLAFVDSRYRAAIVGDLLSVVSTILIEPPEGHLRTYLETLERLLREDLKTVYPAHGPAHRDGPALIRSFLAHRAKREQLLLRALSAEARTADVLVPAVYFDTAPALYPLARRSLLAGLEKLVEDGRAVRVGDGWKMS